MQLKSAAGPIMQIVYDLPGDGAETFVAMLSRELEKLGVPVVILTIRGSSLDMGSIPVICINRASRYDVGFLLRMVNAIKSVKPSIVHAHGYHGKLWGRIAARLAGVDKIVYTEHNSDLYSGPLQRFVNHLLHRLTGFFVTFSNTLARRLVAEDGVPEQRIVVIPNGVPEPARKARAHPPRIDPPIPAGARVILHAGRLMSVKNQQLAIRAYRELCDLRPGQRFCLLLAGAGSDEEYLRKLAAQTGVAGGVRFLGYRNDMDDLMRRSNILLVTSLNEAMPLTVLQAMYAGLPIVTTPWQGAEELLDSGKLGYITASYNPKTVAQALAECFEDPEHTMQSTEAAHRAVRARFDIRLAARRHADLYARLGTVAG